MSALVGYELLSSYVAAFDDDGEAVAAMLRDLKCNQRAIVALSPILTQCAQHARRIGTQRIEGRARRAFRRGLGVTHDVIAARKSLLDEFFALGDGRTVRWGEASVDDHRERIAMLRRNVSGIEATIELHEDAIAQIEAHGAACLDEVPVEDAA
jgi:hypothetical protein